MEELVGGNAGPEVKEVEAKAETNDAPAETQTKDEKPKRNGFDRKLAKKDAEIEFLKSQLNEKPKVEAPKDKPKWDDYVKSEKTAEEYYEDLADWKFEQKSKAKETESQQKSLQKELDHKRETFREKAESFKKETPDFDEALEDYDGPYTPIMEQVLLESDKGPEVTYYLAKHPEEAEKLSKMGMVAAARYVGKLEERMESKPDVKTTKAPPPIKPVGKGTAGSGPRGDQSFQEYKKARGYK